MCRYLLSYLHLISYQVIYILYIKRRRVGSLHSRESTSLLCKQPRKQNRFEKQGKRREERGDAKFKQNSVNILRGQYFKVRNQVLDHPISADIRCDHRHINDHRFCFPKLPIIIRWLSPRPRDVGPSVSGCNCWKWESAALTMV
jgi:hypothetical protein